MPSWRGLYTDFLGGIVTSKRLGGAATGTAGDRNELMVGGHGRVPAVGFEWHVKGTQTILAPVPSAQGLDVNQDQTDNDGIELTNGILFDADRPHSFNAGDEAFFCRLVVNVGDVSGTDDLVFGFRKAEAYQANVDDYDELAGLQINGTVVNQHTILNNAATVETATAAVAADGVDIELEVRVDKARAVTFWVDGVDRSKATYSFDDDEKVVPFLFFLNAVDVADVVALKEWEVGLQ